MDYQKPNITDAVIEKAAQDANACRELMKLFEDCQTRNNRLYDSARLAHQNVLMAITNAGFYPSRVLKYMRDNAPDAPPGLTRLKQKTMNRIEAERERQTRNAQQREYRQRHKAKTEAAIATLTEYGYVELEDYAPWRAITFLKSVTDLVEVPPNSDNWQPVVRRKVEGTPS